MFDLIWSSLRTKNKFTTPQELKTIRKQNTTGAKKPDPKTHSTARTNSRPTPQPRKQQTSPKTREIVWEDDIPSGFYLRVLLCCLLCRVCCLMYLWFCSYLLAHNQLNMGKLRALGEIKFSCFPFSKKWSEILNT
jgi:hypothetical protein